MRFSADCSFHIGAQHLRSGLPCEDYALAFPLGMRSVAIVSDGCSSGGRTDVGSRVVALAKQQAVRGHGLFRDLLAMSRLTLGLLPEDLLATCLTLIAEPHFTSIHIHGDGVAAFQRRDGSLTMYRLDWGRNMPSYPVYADDGYAAFIASQGGPEGHALVVERLEHGESEPVFDLLNTEQHADGWRVSMNTAIRAAAIFSDGVCQVDGMSWQEVVRELMAFKSTSGDFVKRRMNRFLRDCMERGKGPIDDIAMAAIVIEDEP